MSAQPNYTAFELIRENNWDPSILEDLNGDGAKDIVYSAFDPAFGRELHIHYQEEDGGFNASPSRIETKTEIIAVGLQTSGRTRQRTGAVRRQRCFQSVYRRRGLCQKPGTACRMGSYCNHSDRERVYFSKYPY